KYAAFDHLHLRPQLESGGRYATDDDVRRFAGRALRQVDQHDRLLGNQPAPVRIGRDVRQTFDDARLAPIDAALDFGLRAAPNHDDVVVLPGRDERLFEPRRQHQHGREYIYDERHPAGGQDRRQTPRDEIARDVMNGNG